MRHEEKNSRRAYLVGIASISGIARAFSDRIESKGIPESAFI
jgi:hypothetical protein